MHCGPPPSSRRARLPGAALALAVALSASPATPEVWAYVDENGTPHFARERLDERYQLFYKGRSSLDPPPAHASDDPDVEAIRRTKLYARVNGHPNVRRYEPLIERHAKAHALDPALVKAVIAVESAFDAGGISAKGAVGLMQVLPETGERYGLATDGRGTVAQKLGDPATNVRIGTRYLSDLLSRYGNDVDLALAAYNAGEGAVDRHDRRVPPYAETQEYVKLVQAFRAIYRPPPAAAPTAAPARVTIPRRGSADAQR